MLVFFFVIPSIKNMKRSALFGVVMYAAGALALVIARFTVPQAAFLCVVCWALAGYIMGPVLNTLIANTIKDEMRTEVFGLFNMFSMLCMFPAGYVGGRLYDMAPLYPIIFLFAVYTISFIIFVLSGKKLSGQANREEPI